MKIRNFSRVMAFLAIASLSMHAQAQSPICFGSDVHMGDAAYSNFANLLKNEVSASNFFGLVGDQVKHSHTTYPDAYYDFVKIGDTIARYAPNVSWIACQGNHDLAPTDQYRTYSPISGPAPCPSQFAEVFVFGTDQFTSPALIYYLSTYLAYLANYIHNGKLKIIMSHYPIHTKRDGVDTAAQTRIFNLLNSASQGTNALDIIFVWGHNHSVSNTYDNGIRRIAIPGQKIASTYSTSYHHPNANRTLNFTYLQAGYIVGTSSNPNNTTGSVSTILTTTSNRDTCKIKLTGQNWTKIPRKDPYHDSW
jgi:hypothetical protein